MAETKASTKRKRALPELIRKEIGSDANGRYLARMPAFRPEAELPGGLQKLLGELERAERAQVRSR